jgi:hypothetical protein
MKQIMGQGMESYLVVRDPAGDWLVKTARDGASLSIHKSKADAVAHAQAAAKREGHNSVLIDDEASPKVDDSISRIIFRGTKSLIRQKRTSVRRKAL